MEVASWNEYRDIVRISRNETRKAKAHLQLNVAKDVQDNKKGFLKYINNRKNQKDNVGPLVHGGDPGNRGCREGRLIKCLLCINLH